MDVRDYRYLAELGIAVNLDGSSRRILAGAYAKELVSASMARVSHGKLREHCQAKGRALGIFQARPEAVRQARQRERGEELWVKLCGRPVPAKDTDQGVRAVSGDKPIDPASVARCLSQKFGDDLESVRGAMETRQRTRRGSGRNHQSHRCP